MFNMSGRAAAIRATLLAGAVTAALGGLTATAQAFPAMAPMPAIGGTEAARYDGEGYPRHMRHHLDRRGYHLRHGYHHRYGENYHPRHPGHAGLYDCGPGGKATRLSRKACGGNDRFQHLDRPY